jgi:twitching motility protein PilT
MVAKENDVKEVEKLFKTADKFQASDLHLKVGQPPILRIKGNIRTLDLKELTNEDIKRMSYEILNEQLATRLESGGAIDFGYTVPDVGRFRINLFKQRGELSMAARRVNNIIPSFKELHLPDSLEKIAAFPQGLIIICGITGSGKSTTLASIIEDINNKRRCHIVTIEDPIEYLFTDRKAIINQRELGLDTPDFHVALKHVVRQDPDVIVIGEMRDSETFEAALAASETGHLVFVTLHSATITQTFRRILEFFPQTLHSQIRAQLSFDLRAIICQKLIQSIDEKIGRTPATEIMFSNPTTRKLIREEEEHKMNDALRAGVEEGMMTFNQSLVKLVNDNMITRELALEASPNPDALKMALKGISLERTGILE